MGVRPAAASCVILLVVMLQETLNHPVAVLFLIVALGTLLGKIQVAKVSLGTSGVLFVGILAGHLGIGLPREIQELGIILFVYAIGLQAGPRFFHQFRQRGILFAKIGMAVIFTGAAVTWLLTRLTSLEPTLAVGVFAGAMTSTPGLAAAMDAAGDARVGVGFGLAYPFGVLGVVLFVQLLPRLLKIDLQEEIQSLKRKNPEHEWLQKKQFRVSNPALDGKTLAELQLTRISTVNITRLRRKERIFPPRRDTKLELGDAVVAVGTADELEKIELLFGEEIRDEALFTSTDVVARDVTISNEELVGKSLAELRIAQTYGVVVSRVFRESLGFAPTGDYVMELGDIIRLTGTRDDCDRFVEKVGQQEHRIHETNIGILAVGIFLGVLLAYKEFTLPGGNTVRLGLAGGPLFVSLVLAHFGRIGQLSVRIPRGAKHVLQQLGLVLFLAGTGTAAGVALDTSLASSALLLGVGAIITTISAGIGFLLSRYWYRQDILTALGSVSGAMTSTPALGAISDLSHRSESVLAYTGVYPVALIVITVTGQLLFHLL